MTLILRNAVFADASLIASMIHELAAYEKLAHECKATSHAIEHWLFTEHPKAYCLIAEWDGMSAGFALYFNNFSTFLAKPGIYVEDVFVRPEFRRKGIARQIFQRLAHIAIESGCGRLEWWVLDWNTDAMGFYRTLGAKPMDEWTVQRIEGDALRALASTV